MSAPLSVLDLVPIVAGAGAREAVRNTVDLARRTEEFGYRRYWLAEHHFNAGVAGSAPLVFAAIVAAATSRLRVGTAAVLLGNYSPVQVAEHAGALAAAFPGRIDLGLGRSASRPAEAVAAPAAAVDGEQPYPVVAGVVLPPPYVRDRPSPRRDLAETLGLRRVGAGDDFEGQVGLIRDLFSATATTSATRPPSAPPADGADAELWLHGTSDGPSARLAGELALPFGASYHFQPARVREAVAGYRRAFRPSPQRERPYVVVSADVLVAPTDGEAQRLSTGFADWVHGLREAESAIAYPAPDAVVPYEEWTPEKRRIVRDRVETRIVGSPRTVVERLRALRDLVDADELVITTIAHDHEARVESYRLLHEHWTAGTP